jgi:DNA repair protein RecO (recombination protein O)
MAVVSEPALILQTFAYGESSRIVRLLTAAHGVRSAIARGVRSPKARFGAAIEPFAQGIATLHVRENRDLQTLSDFEPTRRPRALTADLLRFAGASLLAEIILRTVGEEPGVSLFDGATAALARIETAGETLECTILAEAWCLVARLGYAPALDACVACGRNLADGLDAHFDYAAGGVRCEDCAPGTPGRTVPAHARSALRHLKAGTVPALERTDAHWRLLRRYLDHHVLQGAGLRSLEILDAARTGA